MELFELECYDGLNATHRWLYITLSNRIFYYNLGLENTFFTYRVQIFDGTLAFDKVRMGILYVYYTGSSTKIKNGGRDWGLNIKKNILFLWNCMNNYALLEYVFSGLLGVCCPEPAAEAQVSCHHPARDPPRMADHIRLPCFRHHWFCLCLICGGEGKYNFLLSYTLHKLNCTNFMWKLLLEV